MNCRFNLSKREQQSLIEVFDSGDFQVFKVVLIDILDRREHGYRDFAQEIGMTREALYQLLRGKSGCRFNTMRAIVKALGFELIIKPLKD